MAENKTTELGAGMKHWHECFVLPVLSLSGKRDKTANSENSFTSKRELEKGSAKSEQS